MKSPVRIPGRLEEPGSKEPLLAAAVHLLSIFSPLWGPLIAWAIFRTSKRFVAAHAWSALVEYIVLKAALLVLGIISIAITITTIIHHVNTNWKDFQWWHLLVRLGITGLFLLGLAAVTTYLSLRQALRAYNGHWPNRDIRKAQRAQALGSAEGAIETPYPPR